MLSQIPMTNFPDTVHPFHNIRAVLGQQRSFIVNCSMTIFGFISLQALRHYIIFRWLLRIISYVSEIKSHLTNISDYLEWSVGDDFRKMFIQCLFFEPSKIDWQKCCFSRWEQFVLPKVTGQIRILDMSMMNEKLIFEIINKSIQSSSSWLLSHYNQLWILCLLPLVNTHTNIPAINSMNFGGNAPTSIILPLAKGISRGREPIRNVIGGVYSHNVTLYFRNSPYHIESDLTIESESVLTIETGVQLYFDSGVGIKVKGAIWAVGNEFAHIQMLPYEQITSNDPELPKFRLIDGPSVRQGRLQVKFRDRWRSVCTKLTNWTSMDIETTCRSMGFSDGGFWKWYRRNNDTYPFVMPLPGCHQNSSSLWSCEGFKDPNAIPLSENLCQGEDDIGIRCWGPPTFPGWRKHWKGLQILSSPFKYVDSDPDLVAVNRESISRLEFIDIAYAGYDGSTRNTTAAVWIEGVPPIMNGLWVENSARDGIHIDEPNGPVFIANSTIINNRGHGVAVMNSSDGRVYINMTTIAGNYGDGIYYHQQYGFLHDRNSESKGEQLVSYDDEKPRLDMCLEHKIPHTFYFPHLIRAYLTNGTVINTNSASPCWMTISLPSRLPYTYTVQFMVVTNKNGEDLHSKTELIICDANTNLNGCDDERYRIPIFDHILPQSVSFSSVGRPIYFSLEHVPTELSGRVAGDVHVMFRIHATAAGKAFYGLNITNTLIANNTGNGIRAQDIRDRAVITNVTIVENEGQAGLLVSGGAADIWINASKIDGNLGDGINISYAGGSVTVNGTSINRNKWRGCAFHQNTSSPYLPVHQEIIFKGRPSNNIFYLRTQIVDNAWGGILIGNFCVPHWRNIQPKILISWTELIGNRYHASIELFSCQRDNMANTIVDITGNRIEGGLGVGLRIEPAVNIVAMITSNQFIANNDTALIIRNARYQHLHHLYAQVTISKNSFKFNTGQSIVSIGMVEGSQVQNLTFHQQNEVRENRVINPYPYLNPRSTPYAALVVSSSNVVINRNCFKNPQAAFEIGSELNEHAKWIDARENNWGHPRPELFMHRIFDQFNRYSLATIEVNPFAAVCNQRRPHITTVQQYYRLFRKDSEPYILGGTIWENQDLGSGLYTVTDDLNVVPGARLTVSPGTVLQFNNGVGMLVQGELIRTDLHSSDEMVKFTSTPFILPHPANIRLVDHNDNAEVLSGRLEIFVDGQWGTVCNRSWTQQLALMACNQLGLIMDPENFENWRIFPSKGELPMVADNIRCEEREYDLTRCRHDGINHNIAASCAPTEVVGLRCMEPRWSGVRYSILANPPSVTGQSTMDRWIIEKAGLFDFRVPKFSPALQIDWNYHTFQNLHIRDNFWNGVDVIYNDLTRKPAILMSQFENNRRNGFKIRSPGITVKNVSVIANGQSGFRYNSFVSNGLQKDIVTWLERREQPEMEANNVFVIPNRNIIELTVYESHLNQRKFLVAKATDDCPHALLDPCLYEVSLIASGHEFGLNSRLAIQIVNRVNEDSDEDILLIDNIGRKQWSVRNNLINFPIVSSSNKLQLKYTRTYGKPSVIILVLFLDTQGYLDRFVHVYQSDVTNNQYAVSSIHYSNWTTENGDLLNRWAVEKLWFQKVSFTGNKEAVLWIHSPQHAVLNNTPIAQIAYHVDNCSIINNTGLVIESHRDLYSSANVFQWNFWSNTFANNINSTITIHLPDTINLRAQQIHSLAVTENRFHNNSRFAICFHGYYAFVNMSSNNFTDNSTPDGIGLVTFSGMEKDLTIERNRMSNNQGLWMLKLDIKSQSLNHNAATSIQFNYFTKNSFLLRTEDYVDTWPRSFTIGIFGSQLADIHYNRLQNILFDFELVSGVKSAEVDDTMNVTYNWWGVANEAAISQRIFDFDDWNIFTLATFSPYYVTEEQFINFWWKPQRGQLALANHTEPSVYDLNGRMYQSKKLVLNRERWHDFPFYYKPFRPYRISKDLTIMPGASLIIERGVEVHIWPNVRILVLGDLRADGTYWEPIRFKPVNTTEYAEARGTIMTRYGRSIHCLFRSLTFCRYRARRRAEWIGKDRVYQLFPSRNRQYPYYQRFDVRLNGTSPKSGFLEFYNATTGEYVPSCDREFTVRNAQVVCRELGFGSRNVYEWLTPRWNYNPKINIRKTYVAPRECSGLESSLDQCPLRLNGNLSMWQCMDNEHFNYIHCGNEQILDSVYIGNWGGITFAHGNVDYKRNSTVEASLLRHVEVVGGGFAHNKTLDIAAVLSVRRNPIFDHVNITNSSMHGLQILSPHGDLILNKLNITQNYGRGISLWLSNLHGIGTSSATVLGKMNILPYNARGLLDICAAQKHLTVTNRIIMFYKYDSVSVDCVKIFFSSGRNIAFRLLLVNMYDGSQVDLGRSDSLTLYSDVNFTERIQQFTPQTSNWSVNVQAPSVLAVHMRASAADGDYGFIADIAAVPSLSQPKVTEDILIRHSRLENNDRGAILYRNTGEIGPNLVISDCAIQNNGYHLYGNITTTTQVIQLHFHNTLVAQFRNNLVMHNMGGLWMTALTTSSFARLAVIVRECAFMHNSNATLLALLGNGNQKLWLVSNLIANNYALYHDTILLKGITANLTRNLFANNTGLHTLDLRPGWPISSDSYALHRNWFQENIAFGHGHQHQERYGFHRNNLEDEFARRPKRQVIIPNGVSFDWWTHVGVQSERYRSTIFAGISNELYRLNSFNNPLNSYELTTGQANRLEVQAIDARENFWGYPGAVGVASGKIRDQSDYEYLIPVDYVPVLESNASLIEGDCPAGWFQSGVDEFKSCFLYVGAAATYSDAVKFCQELDAFLPYLRVNDERQKQLAKRISDFVHMPTGESTDRYNTFMDVYDKHIWISGVTVPLTQCGWLSTRTSGIGTQNCNNLLPFVCEKGVMPYDEPALWRSGIVIAMISLCILLAIIVLLALCWFRKSRKRKEEEMSRKECIRASLRLSKLENERKKNGSSWHNNIMATAGPYGLDLHTDDAIMDAHRNMVHGEDKTYLSMTTETFPVVTCAKNSLVTSFTDRSSKCHSTMVASSKINSNSDSCSANSTESFTYHRTPSSSDLVSQKPDPYAEVSLSIFNTYGSSKSRTGNDVEQSVPWHNTDVSICNTSTDTLTCSTCQDGGESNITERSSWNDSCSLHSSSVSDRTVQQMAKPLLSRSQQQIAQVRENLHPSPKSFGTRPQSTYSKLVDLPPPPLFDPELRERNGPSSVQLDKTYGETLLRPKRIAPPPPSAISVNTQLPEPLRIPNISSPPRRSLYETTAELFPNKMSSRNSSSYRTKIKPPIPPPNPSGYQFASIPQSSQSLVDLITPPSQYQRSNSTGKALPIETSM